jgi:transcriptional regulator with XRE-family HTH domain
LETAQISTAIARRLASRRRELGLSLAQVSARCGVSLQQIHKYEAGISVISAPMLWKLSRCLDAPITYFFETLEDYEPQQAR